MTPAPTGVGTAAPADRAPHVLVLDGDDGVLDRTRAVLEDAGYRVSTADLPDIGLVRRVAPDAILLGLLFRGQATGLAFLERHAADPSTAGVPVVVRAAAEHLDNGQRRRLVSLARPVLSPACQPHALLDQLAASLDVAVSRAGGPRPTAAPT